MAEAPYRSMNQELIDGATDGTLKKKHRNRGGFIDPAADQSRDLLFKGENGYGFGPIANPMDELHGVVRGC